MRLGTGTHGRRRGASGMRERLASGSGFGLVLILMALEAGPAALAQSTAPTSGISLEPPAPTTAAQPEPAESQLMSLDELMNIEVTLATRSPQRLTETASSLQVITGEEIRRSGAITLPQALRLAPNLQVAQQNAHDWAITARGFNGAPLQNNSLADKLLVMIDGRSVYSPLFGGVFWDVQNVLLEDVDRIEVISGPGGSLWGANAVNGVINVVTKSARETQGLYLSGAGGSFLHDFAAFRYGGRAGDNLFYRIYGQRFDYNSTKLPTGRSANDDWYLMQSGFRMDYYPSQDDTFTLQGDLYTGSEGDPTSANLNGGNVLGKWNHVFSDRSDLVLQIYFDAASRHLPGADYGYVTRTYDIDFQHRFPLGDRQTITWGAGYRFVDDNQDNSPPLSFDPQNRDLQLLSGFIQDEIQLVPQKLTLTVGAKVEHNDYSGFEIQPSGRLAWTPDSRNTVWAAASRAVRSPARLDADEVTPFIVTPGDFNSEKVVSYELGYRLRPIDPLSLSISTFYNHYDDLRSINTNPSPPPGLVFANDQRADSWGVELAADARLTEWWRLRGGYTYLDSRFRSTSPAVLPGSDTFEANDPHNTALVQSLMDLPHRLQLDLTARYVDSLPEPSVPSYISVDARLAWYYKNLEFSIVGQNLLETSHAEFGALEIPRSVYARLTLRW